MPFEIATASRILVGEGTVREVPRALKDWGRRILVVTGRAVDRVRPFMRSLEDAGLEPRLFSVGGEPTVGDVEQGAALGREQRVDGVVAMGGGSAIDGGKAIAGLIPNPGDPLRYLEVIGEARPLDKAPLPFAAVPTTAGTGAEVTRNAVLASPEHRVKVSLRSPLLLARLAVVDPELTYSTPPGVTAASGLDALTQLIEPFVGRRANPMVDALCRQGIPLAARALPIAWAAARGVAEASAAKAARGDLALAALYSGFALANAGLGAVHGFAGPIGGRVAAPHGAVCAALLAPVLETNLKALRRRQPGSPALARFEELGPLLTGRAEARAEDAIDWVRAIGVELQVPGLGAWGVTPALSDELIAGAARSSSMKGNPIELHADELADILARAF